MFANRVNELTHYEALQVAVISHVSKFGERCNIYDLLEDYRADPDLLQVYATELRITLRKMEVEGLIDFMWGGYF